MSPYGYVMVTTRSTPYGSVVSREQLKKKKRILNGSILFLSKLSKFYILQNLNYDLKTIQIIFYDYFPQNTIFTDL